MDGEFYSSTYRGRQLDRRNQLVRKRFKGTFVAWNSLSATSTPSVATQFEGQ